MRLSHHLIQTRNAFIRLSLLLIACEFLQTANASDSKYEVKTKENVKLAMRDGTKLATDLFLPDAQGRFPVIVVRTPYGKEAAGKIEARAYAENGWAYVVQDCRGTGKSDGAWDPGRHEPTDGIDLQQWVLSQPWCDGRLATTGGSYVGYTQWAIAPRADDAVKAMTTVVPLIDWYECAYPGGAFQLQTLMGWGGTMAVANPPEGKKPPLTLALWNWDKAFRYLPLSTWDKQIGFEVEYLRGWVAHPTNDEYWAAMRVVDRIDDVSSANLTFSGWYDLFVQQALDHVPELPREARGPGDPPSRHLLIGPWGHGPNAFVGDVTYGDDAKIDMGALQRAWFERHVLNQPNEVDQWATYRYFVMGKNEWRDSESWPLAETQWTQFFLHSDGQANTAAGNGRLDRTAPADEPTDRYQYNPEDPVPTHGGPLLLGPGGSKDQAEIEQRDDVLVYTSAPLETALEITGPVRLTLYAASDARDTDWTAKLVDVDAEGHAWSICDGIVRARYRDSRDQAELLQPGSIEKYEISLWSTSHELQPGHRLRVEVSSSNFPRFDRNPNTGNPHGSDESTAVANQIIYHDKLHPSHLLLPVIPAGD